MKKLVIILLALTVSCGYRIMENSPCKVYVKTIENKTALAGFSSTLSENLDDYIYSYLGGKAKTSETACAVVSLTITAERAKSIQSGTDNRSTVENRTVTLTAIITKDKKTKKYTQNFILLNKYPTNSQLFVDDTKRIINNVSKKMAFQVTSWITANQ